MSKRGQLTLFIIVGLLLMAAVIIIFNLFSSAEKFNPDTSATKGEFSTKSIITNHINNCIETSAKKGLILIGAQGGVIDPQFLNQFQQIEYFEFNRTYYYLEGNVTNPTPEEIEKQLNNYLLKKLPDCLDNLGFLQKQGLTVVKGELSVNSKIGKEKVLVNVDYPLEIVKGKDPPETIIQKELVSLEGLETISIDRFQVTIPVRLGDILSLTDQVLEQQVQNGKKVCLTCIADLSEESGIDILVHPLGQDTLFFSLDDPKNSLDDNLLTYQYVFGGRFK